MHTDARTLENNTLIQGDICIVGAGAAGIAMALDWKDSPYKVILLEGGGFEYEPKIQELYKGETTGQKYYPLMSARLHYFGGTTGHWAGMCSPFDPIDFIDRDWVPESGWPISREDLDPFYAKANETLAVGPYQYDFEYWKEEIPNLNPFPFDQKIFWNKMWQYSQARYSELYRDTIIEAKNIHLYTYANVVDITLNESLTAVSELTTRNHEGKSCRVRASRFILACGTIQNTRLLLASNSQLPNGIGNGYDHVGRYFMEHLEIACGEMWLARPFATDLYSWRYGETITSAEIAFTPEVQREKRILNGTISMMPLSVGKHMIPRMQTWQEDDPRESAENTFANWGEARDKSEEETGAIERAFMLNTRIEQAPNPNSRITIGREKDELDLPRANLHWELTPLDKRSIRTMFRLLGREVGRTGLGRLRLHEFLRDENDDTFPDTTNAGWHHMGTTRMHNDPKKGVVNSDCRVHGIGNLYVAGAACFSTAGAPNPTLTLTALSLRLSDHLKTVMKNDTA
jgi:choline dehydrogenase-like flavoprotein